MHCVYKHRIPDVSACGLQAGSSGHATAAKRQLDVTRQSSANGNCCNS